MSDVGKQTRARGLDYRTPDASRADGIPGTPGKSTLAGQLKPTSSRDIGNPYIEGKAHCQTSPTGDGCFLTPPQRALLVDAYQKVVMQAQMQYTAALVDLKLEKLIQKENDAAVLGFILDVMATMAVGAIGSVLTMVKGKPHAAVDGLESMLALQAGDEAPDQMSHFNFMDGASSAIGWVVRTSVDFGKKSLKGKTRTDTTEKAVSINYIESLQNASTVAWQHQVFDPPGYATDADLIVLFHAFKAEMGHTEPLYKKAINEKVDRYLSSSASRIGRNAARTEKDFAVQGNTARDTKVAWVDKPDKTGGARVLYYLKQDAPNDQNDHTMANHDIPMLRAEGEWKLAGPVEAEFMEVALSRHHDIWGTEPEVRAGDFNQSDPRTWVP